MKKYLLLFLSLLIIATGCNSQSATKEFPKGIPTSADDPSPPGSIHNLPKGCFVMKKINAEEYDCFGCANGNCKDEDLRIWDYTDQDAAVLKGFSCLETNDGCEISHDD